MSENKSEQRHSGSIGAKADSAKQLSEIGGKCSHCLSEDKWKTVVIDSQPTRKGRFGEWLEWSESAEIKCQAVLPYDDDPTQTYICGHTKTIERECEKEYTDPEK